jgi:2-polyprenyl-6-methoxyphenol hydroxylase-like FAD-dependent oxidoreductase
MPPLRALDVGFGDPRSQQELLQRRFDGMGWQTSRLIDALPRAHDFYFDAMSEVRLPRWSTGRTALLGDATRAR